MYIEADTVNEYLVTVFDCFMNRMGAYTAYGISEDAVHEDWLARRRFGEYFTKIDYKGTFNATNWERI